ncbi:MAG TPA: hypothetical protein VJ770_23770 [Stellaceae bacterium]|nr:hypothetical protein [Stellaceae bacterium]
MIRPIAAALIGLALTPGPAAASQQGENALKNWKRMDSCAQQAQTAHPDYTAASNEAREAALKTCLENGSLPPRQPLSPPPSR